MSEIAWGEHPAWGVGAQTPKDGRKVIACLEDPETGQRGVDCIRWHEPWNCWVLGGVLLQVKDFPVAWMPMPEPIP